MKCVTLSVDIGVYVPEEIDDEDIALHIPHELVGVQTKDGKPIQGGKVVCHTTTGVVDSFTEEESEKWRTEPLPEKGFDNDGVG